MTEPPSRPTIEVAAPVGGWPHPWPNVAELVAVLPAQQWTLVGGLMTQLHSIHHGLGVVRPTNDVDIVLHIETRRGVPTAAATALEQIGYRLQSAVDPRNNTAHRFVRGQSRVDLVAGDAEEVVDVLMADHPAPMVVELLRGQEMSVSRAAPRRFAAPSTRDWRSSTAPSPPSRCRDPSGRSS